MMQDTEIQPSKIGQDMFERERESERESERNEYIKVLKDGCIPYNSNVSEVVESFLSKNEYCTDDLYWQLAFILQICKNASPYWHWKWEHILRKSKIKFTYYKGTCEIDHEYLP